MLYCLTACKYIKITILILIDYSSAAIDCGANADSGANTTYAGILWTTILRIPHIQEF